MSSTERVWYVSYGSNLNRARFLAYLQGGRVAGNDVVYRGCADTSPPVDDVALEVPHALYFAGWSARVWGGTSAAFTTLAARSASTLARAYLITQQQFVEVVRQENANRADVDDFDVKLEGARQHGHTRMLPRGTTPSSSTAANETALPWSVSQPQRGGGSSGAPRPPISG